MQNSAAWAIAILFAALLIEFKGSDTQHYTNLTVDQWNQPMQSLASMPMMMSTMQTTRHTQPL